MHPGPGDDWLAISTEPLPVAEAASWAVRPDCGAVVTFSGTVRNHADGHPGVVRLHYEAYEDYVVPRLVLIAAEARQRWGSLGRLAILHRVGNLAVEDTAVLVAASTPHRAEAFAAATFCIDTLKATVPIWKFETWEGGAEWVTGHDGEAVRSTP